MNTRSDSPGAVLPLSASVLAEKKHCIQRQSVSKGAQHSVYKHLSLMDSLEL